MSTRAFRQVDVFGSGPYSGNPLAVVLDGQGLTTEDMKRFSAWTNLSECTFILPPTSPDADYSVRIFSLTTELPFAGHPTLGSAGAWLDAGGVPRTPGVVVQECGVGLVTIRRDDALLSFAAPALRHAGPVEPERLAAVLEVLGLAPDEVLASAWIDNGPGWLGLLLADAAAVRAVNLPTAALEGQWSIGLVGAHAKGVHGADGPDLEVRAFFNDGGGVMREDPVTGSLNASVAQWLLGRAGIGASPVPAVTAPYVAAQGGALGRAGRVVVTADERDVWVGGAVDIAISGTVNIKIAEI